MQVYLVCRGLEGKIEEGEGLCDVFVAPTGEVMEVCLLHIFLHTGIGLHNITNDLIHRICMIEKFLLTCHKIYPRVSQLLKQVGGIAQVDRQNSTLVAPITP